MHLLRHSFALLALVLPAAYAQVSVTASTAGIDPNTSNPQFSPGLNGLSTGATVVFTALATGPTPSISRMTVTLSGAALSDYEASIATQYSQAMGSNFAYTTTTGGMISAVANTLPGGYDAEQSALAQSTTTVQPGSEDAAPVNVEHASAGLRAMGVAAVAVLGAVVVL